MTPTALLVTASQCTDYWINRNVWDAIFCAPAEPSGVGMLGVTLIIAMTGVKAIYSWSGNVELPIIWMALMGGVIFASVPGPLDRWMINIITVVLMLALYGAIRRLK